MTSLAPFTRTTVLLDPIAILLLNPFWNGVAGVNVYSWKGTQVPSAILDSTCKSRFVTLYTLLIRGDINPDPGPR